MIIVDESDPIDGKYGIINLNFSWVTGLINGPCMKCVWAKTKNEGCHVGSGRNIYKWGTYLRTVT